MNEHSKYVQGYSQMLMGWKLTIETDQHIKIENGALKDIGYMLPATSPRDDLIVEYSTPEKIPKSVRTGVKVIFRKILARRLKEAS